MSTGIHYLEEPERVAVALSPLRRQLLGRLREAASATQLAAALDLPRQRVNYHLRALESAGLVEVVEERRRRGCVERILRTKPGALVVDPGLMEQPTESTPARSSANTDTDTDITRIQDNFAAEHLVEVAAATVREVARMQVRAEQTDKRLLTFTVQTQIRFGGPADVHRFTDRLTGALRQIAESFHDPDGRPYRVVIGGHPAPAAEQDDPS